MQNTTNFNFNLPEGTDLWNYLTQTNPNFTALDSILKSVQDGTVTTATEVTSGTAHAVTRTLPDANVIRFTATGVWTLGDTMTIDGTPVTVVKPNGTSLQTGDYIIGSEVLGVLRATQFTVYVGGASSLDAADVTYDNTGSGLTANDVQDAIDEVNSNLTKMLSTRILSIRTSDIPSGGNVTVPDISDYKALYFALVGGDGTSINGSAFIPTDIFNLGGTLVVPNQGAMTLATFKYISDTVINMDYPGTYIHIYGIK